jgi:hypothetical protein
MLVGLSKSIFYDEDLRYSLVPFALSKIKYIERWGINVLIVIKLLRNYYVILFKIE